MGFVVINSKGFRHRRDRRPHTQRHRTQPPNIARMVGSQNIRIRECSTSEPNRPDTSRKMNRINFGHDRGSPPNSLARRGEAARTGEQFGCVEDALYTKRPIRWLFLQEFYRLGDTPLSLSHSTSPHSSGRPVDNFNSPGGCRLPESGLSATALSEPGIPS